LVRRHPIRTIERFFVPRPLLLAFRPETHRAALDEVQLQPADTQNLIKIAKQLGLAMANFFQGLTQAALNVYDASDWSWFDRHTPNYNRLISGMNSFFAIHARLFFARQPSSTLAQQTFRTGSILLDFFSGNSVFSMKKRGQGKISYGYLLKPF
jgi:hypothetical protein